MEWFEADLGIFDQRINVMKDLYKAPRTSSKQRDFELLTRSIQKLSPRLSNESQLAYIGRVNLIARDTEAFWCIPKKSYLYKQLTSWLDSLGLKECLSIDGYVETADSIYYLGSLAFKNIGHELLGGQIEDDYTTTAAFLIFANN